MGVSILTMKGWAEELGRKDPDALKGYLEKATPIAALTQLQSKGKARRRRAKYLCDHRAD